MRLCPSLLSLWLAVAAIVPLSGHTRNSTLPAPSRDVYKCNHNGKVVYSDEPCLGAERLAIEPTRGLDKSTGRELSGADVQRERRRESMADAIRPITGIDAKQFETATRRHQLTAEAKAECRALDREIASFEKSERAGSAANPASVQGVLLALRRRHRELGC